MADNTVNSDSQQTVSEMCEFDKGTILSSIEDFQSEIDDESELRDKMRTIVKNIDKTIKHLNFEVMDIHQHPADENLLAIGNKIQARIKEEVHPRIAELESYVQRELYYKYNDVWRHAFQRLVTVATLSHFFRFRSICSIAECAQLFQLATPNERKSGKTSLFLDFDDYVSGILDMASELSRLSRNCITFGGSITTVHSVHACLNKLNGLLHNVTFKNDYLRKKYDGLKYHLKTVEEVVYDVKLNEMNKQTPDAKLTSDPHPIGT